MLSLSSGFLTNIRRIKSHLAVLRCQTVRCAPGVCGVSGFKPTVKRNNLRTLCGVVVYHLAVVTETRNRSKRAKRPKRSTTTQSDKQRLIKTNKQKIHNDPIKQAKTSSALLGTLGELILISHCFFIAGAKPDLCGLFIQKRLQNKWITGEICMGLFFSRLSWALYAFFYLHDEK